MRATHILFIDIVECGNIYTYNNCSVSIEDFLSHTALWTMISKVMIIVLFVYSLKTNYNY